MKISINLFLLFYGILFSCNAQKTQHVFQWKVSTASEGAFIGITDTKKQALLNIEQLMSEKKGEYNITNFEIHFSSLPTAKNIFDDFFALTPDHTGSVFLTQKDLEAIRINKNLGKSAAIQYYNRVNHFKDQKAMLHYLENNVLAYEKFIFIVDKETSKREHL